MMCIIRIVDGKPFEHPIMLNNFQQAFPDIDLNAPLPDGFAWFERKLRPELEDLKERFVTGESEYIFDGNVWTDSWKVRDHTAEELQEMYLKIYNNYKQHILDMKQEFPAAEDQAFLQNQYDLADAYSKENPLVFRHMFAPHKNESGIWISTNAPGTSPNVIG